MAGGSLIKRITKNVSLFLMLLVKRPITFWGPILLKSCVQYIQIGWMRLTY